MERRLKIFLLLMGIIVVLIVLFGVFVRFPEDYNAGNFAYHSLAQDIGVMVLVGYGLRYSSLAFQHWAALGATYLVTPICALFFVLFGGLWHNIFKLGFRGYLYLTVPALVDMYQAAACGIIATMAILGKGGIFEYCLLLPILMGGYSLNRYLLIDVLGFTDSGGAVLIHVFGGAAGLIYSKLTHNPKSEIEVLQSESYKGQFYVILGTAILWLFYPSFNAGTTVGLNQQLAIYNTVYALCSATLVSLAFSYYQRQRILVADIAIGSLSGAISVGASGSFTVNPGISYLQGAITAAAVVNLNLLLGKRFRNADALNVFLSHLVPGVIGGLWSSIFFLGYHLTEYISFSDNWVAKFDGSFPKMAGTQFVGVLITILLATFTAAIPGLLLRLADNGETLDQDVTYPVEAGVTKLYYHDGMDYLLE